MENQARTANCRCMRNERFEGFVQEWLRNPGRVLEIGYGDGELTRFLAAHGHEVVAIDPQGEDRPPYARTSFEDFAAPERSFSAIVASRSLHHIPDLSAALQKMAGLLDSSGVVLINEYGWERFDMRTASWLLKFRPNFADPGELFAEWTAELSDLHTSLAMRAALDALFDERAFSWQPHLSAEFRDSLSERLEIDAIDRGEISPLGFFYAGALQDVG
ncbi:MAG: class I SAM-dependent methyltransferase [Candidatus Eremiobacteraeota bacterium]|nr:class I SAM-dependent methyltransferase [Candidatus Eremiobacteraeota bacterium]